MTGSTGLPSVNLQFAHIALLDWIDAARAFDRYSDAGPVAALLQDERAQQLTAYAQTLQLNTVRDISKASAELVEAFESSTVEGPLPFNLILPRLLELPRGLSMARYDWKSKIILAERHAAAGNMGLAVLQAWEAVVDRLAQAYNLSADRRRAHGVYRALSSIATGHPKEVRELWRVMPKWKTTVQIGAWSDWTGDVFRPHFGQVARTLQKIRDGIAHANEGLGSATESHDWSFEPLDVYLLMQDDLLGYLRRCFDEPTFEQVSERLPDWKTAAERQ